MKHDFYRALEKSLEDEFVLPPLELKSSSAETIFLATAIADGALAMLVLHPAVGGRRELDVLHALSGEHQIGITWCRRCGTVRPGWPRFCVGCVELHELWGVPVDEPDAGSIDVQKTLDHQWPGTRLLGSIPYTAGGGAMYFVQGARVEEGQEPPVVGMVIDRNDKGRLSLVRCWAMDEETLDAFKAKAGPAGQAAQGNAGGTPAPEGISAPATLEENEEGSEEGGVPLHRRRGMQLLAAALVVGAIACIPLIRGPAETSADLVATDSVVPPVDTIGRDSGVVPPVPVDSTRGKGGTTRRPPPRTPVDPPTPPVTSDPPAPAPDPEMDRQQVLSLARGFATAYGTTNMERVRAAYPGISATEDAEWAEWFSRNLDVQVGFILNAGPDLRGDSATINFTLLIKYPNGLRCRVYDGTTVRMTGTWSLQRLTGTDLNARTCRNLYRNWQRDHGPR